jgi:hypothetical protein
MRRHRLARDVLVNGINIFINNAIARIQFFFDEVKLGDSVGGMEMKPFLVSYFLE